MYAANELVILPNTFLYGQEILYKCEDDLQYPLPNLRFFFIKKIFWSLKVVSGEKEGGLRVGSIDRYWLGTAVLEVYKNREFAVVFYIAYIRFRPLQHFIKQMN